MAPEGAVFMDTPERSVQAPVLFWGIGVLTALLALWLCLREQQPSRKKSAAPRPLKRGFLGSLFYSKRKPP
jgi:hypothetical protein